MVSLEDLDRASLVLPTENVNISQSMMMDFVIQPLRNLIEEKKIVPGSYRVLGTSPSNETILFTACVKTFNDNRSIKSQVISSYDPKNKTIGKLIGKIRVLFFGKTYSYEVYDFMSLN
jgi:hypothetical protein